MVIKIVFICLALVGMISLAGVAFLVMLLTDTAKWLSPKYVWCFISHCKIKDVTTDMIPVGIGGQTRRYVWRCVKCGFEFPRVPDAREEIERKGCL